MCDGEGDRLGGWGRVTEKDREGYGGWVGELAL